MAWIEFHTALRDHWKIQRLADLLKIPYCQALGSISCLWLWCVENSPKGDLGRFTNDELCRAMRLESVSDMKNLLKNCELIDETGKVNDWRKHGLKYLLSARKRMKQYRKRLRNRNVTVTPTLPTIPNQKVLKPIISTNYKNQNQNLLKTCGKPVENPQDFNDVKDRIAYLRSFKLTEQDIKADILNLNMPFMTEALIDKAMGKDF